MQYSTNSDEALRFTIRSQPTLSGQYRQAVLQIRDRLQALENFKFSAAKAEQTLSIARIRREQHRLKKPTGAVEFGTIEIWQAELNLLDIEIQQKTAELKQGFDLVDDAEREVEVCRREIERINIEANTDFAEMESSDFQVLMADDFRDRKSRAIASQLIAGSPTAIEMLIELPEGDRPDYLRRVSGLIKEVDSVRMALASINNAGNGAEEIRSINNGAA